MCEHPAIAKRCLGIIGSHVYFECLVCGAWIALKGVVKWTGLNI